MRMKQKLSIPRSMPSLFRMGFLKLFKHVFEYLMTISPPPTPLRALLFSLSGLSKVTMVYEVAIASWSSFLSIRKSKYQRDIASNMKQLCNLIRTWHSSRSLSGTGFLRWNRRGELEHQNRVTGSLAIVFARLLIQYGARNCKKD